jgi:hypothetical protein
MKYTRLAPPEVQIKTMYEYIEECGGHPEEDDMLRTITIATTGEEMEAVVDYIRYALKITLQALQDGTAVPGEGDVRPREYLSDVGLWLIRESFAFEEKFPQFSNSMRLLSRQLRDLESIETGTELYHEIYTIYQSFRV